MARSAFLEEAPSNTIVNFHVREGRDEYTELDIQNIWGRLGKRDKVFKTIAGSDVRVLHSGEKNLFDGPDFKNALIEINGIQFRGDVEIHKDLGDWYRHGHHWDRNYDRVILHVVIKYGGKPEWVETSQGRKVETIVIDSCSDNLNIGTSIKSLEVPPCLRQIYFDFPSIIRMLAQERLYSKIEKIKARARIVNINQALYEQIFWGLGAGTRFADVYLRLAERVTYPYACEISQKDPSKLEKIYQQELGYVTTSIGKRGTKIDSTRYEVYDEKYMGCLSIDTLGVERNYLISAYPPSLPPTRIALMASLMNSLKKSLAESVLDFLITSLCFPKPWLKWQEFFLPNYTRTKEEKGRGPLVGLQKIITLLGNVIIPFAFYCYFEGMLGINEESLWKFYFALPGECENWILRRMKVIRQIVISRRALKFFEQQGLIQWYKNNCAHHPNCQGCHWDFLSKH